MNRESRTSTGYVFAATTLIIWSGFVVVSRYGSKGILNPFDIAALRIGTAALVLAPWWLPRLFDASKRRLALNHAISFALLAGIGYPLVAYSGFIFAPASHGAVLISGMLPFFTSILAWFLLAEKPSRMRLLGLVFILLGVAVLLANSLRSVGIGGRVVAGDLILLTASVLWSLFTVLLRFWRARAFDVTLGVTAVSALFYLPVYLLLLPKHLTQASLQDILVQAIFQGVMVVCVALWTYARAIEILGTVRVVIMMSTVPVVGALMAVPVLGESLNMSAAIGAATTFLGALIGALAKPDTR